MTAVRRIRPLPRGADIPMATQATVREIDELMEVWRLLRLNPRLRHARAAIARLLTTRAEDL